MPKSTLRHPSVEPRELHEAMLRHYKLAREQPIWKPAEINPSVEELSSAWREWAWRLTSASVFAEQTGLLVASKLVHEVDDLTARLCLATAASDEARHVETFVYAAETLGGQVMDIREDVQQAYNQLLELPSWMDRFVIHTFLECYASDEFLVFARRLGDSLPGRCYQLVRRDEARHVQMGLAYLSYRLRDPAFRETRHHMNKLQALANRIGGVDDDFYTNLAKVGKTDPERLRSWFENRQRARLARTIGLDDWDWELYE